MHHARPIVLGLDHVTLPIADLDDAAAFYGGVLGAGVQRWPDRLVVRFGIGPDLHLYLAPPSPAPPDPVIHVGLRVDPEALAVFLGRLAAHGIPSEGPSRVGADGAALHFHDPFGNHLELISQGYRGPVLLARTSPPPRGAGAGSSTRTSPR